MFKTFKQIYLLLILNKKGIKEIAKTKSATADGLLIIFLGGIASIIGLKPIIEMEEYRHLAFDFTINNVIFLNFLFLLAAILYTGFSFLISKLLGAECKFKEYFRTMAFANILNLYNLSLTLSTFSSMWFIIVNYQILKTLNRFTPIQAFLTLITTFLSLFAFATLLT